MKRLSIVLLVCGAAPALMFGQGGRGGRGGPPPVAVGRVGAPVDLTGYWVSIISEDWRWRMVTPLKGDAASVPTTAAARMIIDAWDPAKDEAAGNQCKSYGAAAIMRVPGRVHITWDDDMTLKVEADAGQQTRVFHFGGKAPAGAERTWQGYSVANWEAPPRNPGGSNLGTARIGTGGKALEVVTTNLKAGYLRKNGVPYSENAVVNEYYDRHTEPNGDEWFTVTTVVTDPQYLTVPFVTSSDFKKEPDGSKWSPEPCKAR
jgi:hypothetical protein